MKATVEGINQVIRNNDIDANLISDGYHTIGELYEHRIQLWIVGCRFYSLLASEGIRNGEVWRTEKHSDGQLAFGGGWFVLGITHSDAFARETQLTYHLPMKYWDDCKFATVLKQAPTFDNHTSKDVLERLKQL